MESQFWESARRPSLSYLEMWTLWSLQIVSQWQKKKISLWYIFWIESRIDEWHIFWPYYPISPLQHSSTCKLCGALSIPPPCIHVRYMWICCLRNSIFFFLEISFLRSEKWGEITFDKTSSMLTENHNQCSLLIVPLNTSDPQHGTEVSSQSGMTENHIRIIARWSMRRQFKCKNNKKICSNHLYSTLQKFFQTSASMPDFKIVNILYRHENVFPLEQWDPWRLQTASGLWVRVNMNK